MTKPNIVYMHSHDTGRYVEPYGYAVSTPRIQRLAEEGIVFRNCFSAAPTCGPSRAALLTGQCPHSNGMFGLTQFGWRLNDYGDHLVHSLSGAGYYTALIGCQHVHHPDRVDEIGYDECHVDGYGPRAAEVIPVARKFLDDAPQQPFFLAVGVSETHRFYANTFANDIGLTGDPRYCRPPAPIPDTPETRRDMADYIVGAKMLDDAVGSVLDALRDNGLADNTLVICTTDHGVPFPTMKSHVNDHGTGVMLIMRGPGGFDGGRTLDALVSQIDLYPTLCELLEIDPPDRLEGRSMMPLVRGESEEINEQVFAEQNHHAGYEPVRSVRTKRWRYTRRWPTELKPGDHNADSITRKCFYEHGWRERPRDEEELYDLFFDPNGACNLANDPAHAERLADMRGRLKKWMEETNDPLLAGEVPTNPLQEESEKYTRAGTLPPPEFFARQ